MEHTYPKHTSPYDYYKESDSSDDPYKEPASPGSPQGGKGSDTTFLMKDSRQGNFLIYPRFLIGMDLNETAKLIYILLLDRGRLSAKQEQYVDDAGRAYVYYDIQSLAANSGKSATTVKAALRDLENADLILRGKQKTGNHRPIYVKTRTASHSTKGSKSRPASGAKSRPTSGSKSRPSSWTENSPTSGSKSRPSSWTENSPTSGSASRPQGRRKTDFYGDRNSTPYNNRYNKYNKYNKYQSTLPNYYDLYDYTDDEGESL